MSRRAWLLVALIALLTVVAGALAQPPAPGPTTFGSSGAGLLSAYRYLEARGHPVDRWERPLTDLPSAQGTLVLAAPFAVGFTTQDTRALRTWMGQGGTVLVMPSGARPEAQEGALLDGLGLYAVERRTDAPLGWAAWKTWRTVERVGLAQTSGGPGPLHVRAETHAVRVPQGAELLYVDDQGEPLAWRLAQGPGSLIVLANATPLSNALLGRGDNLAVLEALLGGGGPVRFDEVHHGHLASELTDLSAVIGPFELLLVHIVLLYLLALVVLARRHGPALERIRVRRGSLARDLEALASLHRKGKHQAQAGSLLLRLAHDQARRRGTQPDLPEAFSGGDAELVALARQIGEDQRAGRL